MNQNTNSLLSISEVLDMSGLGRTKIYQEISQGRLKALKCGRRTLIPSESIQAWISSLPSVSPRI